MGIQGLSGLGGLNNNQNNQNQSQNTNQGVAGIGGLGGIGGNQNTNQNTNSNMNQNMNQRPTNSNVVSLKKGQKVSLKKTAMDAGVNSNLTAIKVGLGWDINRFDGSNFDLDVFTFALRNDGKVRDESDFIFFNNMKIKEGSIVLSGDNRSGQGQGDDETVNVDLANLPMEIEKIAFCITINDAESKNQNFGMVDNAYVRFVDQNSNQEFLRYDLSEDYSLETALVVGELYKHNNEWKFRAIGSGYQAGLVALCAEYGVSATN